MSNFTILLDCDGVLVESNSQNLRRLNKEFGTDYRFEEITSFRYDFLTDEEREFIYEECWHDPHLYDDAEVTEAQEQAIKMLRDLGRVVVVSSPLLGHIESKYRFLQKHFKRENIVLASDKGLLDGDVLIDDGPHNLEPFEGDTIVYDRPWNQDVEGPRARDFFGIVTHVQRMKEEQSAEEY